MDRCCCLVPGRDRADRAARSGDDLTACEHLGHRGREQRAVDRRAARAPSRTRSDPATTSGRSEPVPTAKTTTSTSKSLNPSPNSGAKRPVSSKTDRHSRMRMPDDLAVLGEDLFGAKRAHRDDAFVERLLDLPRVTGHLVVALEAREPHLGRTDAQRCTARQSTATLPPPMTRTRLPLTPASPCQLASLEERRARRAHPRRRAPGIGRIRLACSPAAMRTASNSPIRWSIGTSLPISTPQCRSMPIATRSSISPWRTSRGRRYEGTPEYRAPPGLSSFSYTTTL